VGQHWHQGLVLLTKGEFAQDELTLCDLGSLRVSYYSLKLKDKGGDE